MVVGTHSSSIAELDKKLEDEHSELSSRIEQMNLGMDDIHPMLHENNVTDGSVHSSNQQRLHRHDSNAKLTNYSSTHISNVEFLKFDGKKVKECLYR